MNEVLTSGPASGATLTASWLAFSFVITALIKLLTQAYFSLRKMAQPNVPFAILWIGIAFYLPVITMVMVATFMVITIKLGLSP